MGKTRNTRNRNARLEGSHDFDTDKYLQQVRRDLVNEKAEKKRIHPPMIFALVIVIALAGIAVFNPSLVGFVTSERDVSLNKSINLEYASNSEYELEIGNYAGLKSLRISGQYENGTNARIYIENEGNKYLVFEIAENDTGAPAITGFAVKEEDKEKENKDKDKKEEIEINESIEINETLENETTIEEPIEIITPINETINDTINLNKTLTNETIELNETINETTPIGKSISAKLGYYSNSFYDEDNDGIEAKNGIIDLDVSASFSWEYDESKLCTRWEVYSIDADKSTTVCYGSGECCAFMEIGASRDSWKEPLYLSFNSLGATHNNIVSVQVIHADVEAADVAYSNWSNLTATFEEEGLNAFENECVDTCSLAGFNKSSYQLIVEVESGRLVLGNLNYVAVERVKNNAPEFALNVSDYSIKQREIVAVNLSKHFVDADNDKLNYDYYESDGFRVEFEENIAKIIPDDSFTGQIFTFFTANDTEDAAVSNVFAVNVTEGALQMNAEINKPVVWVKKASRKDGELRVPLLESAHEIKVKDGLGEISSENILVDDKGYLKTLSNYETEKKIGKLGRKLSKEAGKEKSDLKKISDAQEELDSLMKGYAPEIIKVTGNEDIDLIVSDDSDEIEVTFSTDAPEVVEVEKDAYTKIVTISSELSYTNVLAYTTIPEAPRDNVKIYWLKDGMRELFANVTLNDTDGDSNVDYAEWIVPHLSNQTFEISITVLNVQSYPMVGSNWTVAFNTSGVGNLTISAVNLTSYAEKQNDELLTEDDLDVLELKCGGDVIFNYNDNIINSNVYLVNENNERIRINDTAGNSVLIKSIYAEDYSCGNKTGYWTVKVLTSGVHDQLFNFSGQLAEAHNDATKKKNKTLDYKNSSYSVVSSDWNSNTAEIEDGKKVTQFHIKWVNYLDENDEWQPINSTIVNNGTQFVMTDAPFEFTAPLTASGIATFHNNNKWDVFNKTKITASASDMRIRALGVANVTGEVEIGNLGYGNDTYVIYRNAYPSLNADLIYYVHHGKAPRLQKLVKFNSAVQGNTEVEFEISFSEDPEIDYQDNDNKKQKWKKQTKIITDKKIAHQVPSTSQLRGFGFKDFFIWDSNGKREKINIHYTKNGSSYILSKQVKGNFFNDAVLPVFTDTTSTFYPDPNAETTSVDGRVERSSVDESWSSIRGGAGVGAEDSVGNIATRISASGTTNQYDFLDRAVMLFDTSSIPDTDYIDSVTLATDGRSSNTGLGGSISVVSSTPASNTAVAAGDYGNFGTTKFASDISIGSLSTTDYNTWTFNAAGLTAISKTGVSKFGMRVSNDVDNSEPSWSNQATSLYEMTAADTAGTSEDPKLTVEHSEKSPVINKNFTIPTYPRFGENVTIVVNATDLNNNILFVNFTVTAPNGSITNFSNKSRVNDMHNFSINLTSYGTWKWNVTVVDVAENYTNSTTGFIYLMEINQSLNVTSIAANSPVAVFGHINLSNDTNVSNRLIGIFINDGGLNGSITENGTEFILGKGSNVTINVDNITLQANSTNQYTNQTGNFTSQVIFIGPIARNFSIISWEGEAHYGQEIGRALEDKSNGVLPYVNTSGLITLYHFNNESAFGEQTTGLTNRTLDFSVLRNSERASSKHNNATLMSSATINNTQYKLGKSSMNFDGNQVLGSYLNLSPLSMSRQNYTFSLWLKTGSVKEQVVYIEGNTTAAQNYLRLETTGPATINPRDATIGEEALTGTKNVSNNLWHHVVMVKRNVNTAEIWVDGSLDVSGTITLYPGTDKSTIGGFRANADEPSDQFFNGTIDEFAVWNRSLSKDEIINLYKRGVLRLNLSVRSCDDSACSGEAFSEALTNNSGTKLNTTITPLNRYFQYRATLQTDDVNITPALYNVTINYTTLATDRFGNYNFTFISPSTGGLHKIKVNATTDIGIPGEQIQSLSVLVPPVINRNYTIPTYPQFGRNATIVVNATDVNSDIIYVNFTVTAPNGSITNFSNKSRVLDMHNFSINLTSYGTWKWNVTVSDVQGNDVSETTGQIILMEITESLNVTSSFSNAPIAVFGHINLSNNTNVSLMGINIFLNEDLINSNITNPSRQTIFENGTQFTSGKASNVTIAADNITLMKNDTNNYPNQTGNFTSRIIDTFSSSSNFTIISWQGEVPYKAEIGRAIGDGNDAKLPNINTTGLVTLLYFNNESAFNENNTKTFDFSKHVNLEDNEFNNATCTGALCPSYNFTERKLGPASMNFDGADDYLNLSSDTSLDKTFDGTRNMTVSMWYNLASLGAYRTLFAKGGIGSGTDYSGSIAFAYDTFLVGSAPCTNKGYTFQIYAGAGTTDLVRCWPDSSFPLNQWNHIAIVYRSDLIDADVYINGENITESTLYDAKGYTGSAIDNNGKDFTLGAGFLDGHEFIGKIDEVSLWNRTLSKPEISSLYKRGIIMLNLSARSCDDAACSGEAFSESLTNNSGARLNQTITPINRYFQYRATMQTDDANITPALYNVTINHTAIATNSLGNYNFTFKAPSVGTYTVKVNTTTDIGIPGEQMQTLSVISIPVINKNYTIPTYPRFGQNVTIVANVTDEDNTILFVNFTLTAPNGSIINLSNKSRSLDLHNTSFNLSSYGTWKWNVTVFDTQGSLINSTSTGQIILMEITQAFNFSSVNINDPVAVYGHINLSNNSNLSNSFIKVFLNDNELTGRKNATENGTSFLKGKASNVTINANNITLMANSTNQYTNQTGNFTSQIIDAGMNSNFTLISWGTEASYGTEIGRAVGDGNDAKLSNINTTGLIVLHYFNGENGESESLAKDFSIDVNPERAGQVHVNGTISNGARYNTTDKKLGNASMQFDGGDEKVDAGDISILDVAFNEFTVAMWVQPINCVSSGSYITGKMGGAGNRGWQFACNNDRTLTVNYAASAGGSVGGIDTTDKISYNEWNHVAFTFKASTYDRIYINGVLVNDSTTGVGSALNGANTASFQIGNRGDNIVSQYYDGAIDEYAIWNRSLSTAEILNLYKRGAIRLNISVRSCDDSNCAGENFSQALTNNSGTKLNNSIAPLNKYFQYRATLQTDDVNITPALYNVSINYTRLFTDSFGNYNLTFNAPSSKGTYSVKVNATNDIGIPGEQMQALSVVQIPVINYFNTSHIFGQFENNITLQVNATDDGLFSVNFTLIAPNGSKVMINRNASSRSGDLFTSASNNLTDYGKWIWNVSVYDIENNIVNSSIQEIVLMEVTIGLNVSHVNPDTSVYVFGKVNLSNNTNVSNRIINAWLNDGPININSFANGNVLSSIENGTQFALGKGNNVTIAADNITLMKNDSNQYPNQTGNFTSQVVDLNSSSNFTFISWEGESAYGAEIGRAVGDGNDAKLPSINTSGLVLLLHFNNESGFGENDTNATDFSIDVNPERAGKAHNNASLRNGAHYNFSESRFGKGSVEIDGSNDAIIMSNEVDVDFERTDRFSLGLWVKTPPAPNGGAFLAKQENSGDFRGYTLWEQAGSYKIHLQGNGGADILEVIATTNISDDRWHLITVTYTGTADSSGMKLYVDGVLDSMTVGDETVSGSIKNNVNPTIGSRDSGGSTYTQKARFDEVFIFNRTLRADEVMNIYKRGAIRLNLSVRSCNDIACSGEQFSEPLTNNSGTRLNTSITPNNRYFQYRATLQTDDVNITPALYNVTINYTTLATDRFGRYNFTLIAPSTLGEYKIKVNATNDVGAKGEKQSLLTVVEIPSINTKSTIPTNPQFGRFVTLQANVTDDNLIYVNFTLIGPNGSKVINANGSHNGGNLFNSSRHNITNYGTWLWNISVVDADGFVRNTTTQEIILMEITESINSTTTLRRLPISASGHINLSNGSNLSNSPINLFINDLLATKNNSLIENGTQFATGIGSNVTINADNITLMKNDSNQYPNQTGNFSRIIDLETTANISFISWEGEAHYGTEIGRAIGDGNYSKLPNVNTSGLVLLFYFNNESAFGENDTNVTDYSIFVNPEMQGSAGKNGSVIGGAHANYSEKKLGKGAMNFDGSNDYVQVPNLDFNTLTFAAWIKRDRASGGGTNDRILLSIPNNGWGVGLNNDANDNQLFITKVGVAGAESAGTIADTNWHHVVVTADGTNARFYIDGTLDTTVSWTQTYSGGGGYSIGARGTGEFYYGMIDELAVWNRSITAAEVLNLYKRGIIRLNLSVRSCDDSICSGETFSEPLTNNSGIKLNNSITPNNKFLQYRVTMQTDDVNITPALYNVTINFTPFVTDKFGNYNFTFTAPSSIGAFSIKVNATTDIGIPGEQMQSLTVIIPPVINRNFTIPTYLRFGQNVTIVANVTDDDNDILFVNFTLTAPNGSIINLSNKSRSLDLHNTSFNLSSYGTWKWNVTVFDNNGNLVNSTSSGQIILMEITESLNVSISNINSPIAVYGRINLSNNTNVSHRNVELFINEEQIHKNNSAFENGTQFAIGTASKTTINADNVTLQANSTKEHTNQTGTITSQVIFVGPAYRNFTTISWGTEFPYQTEIGGAIGDGPDSTGVYVNTSGLVLLYHFDNESGFGENNSIARDFSPFVNPAKENFTNGSYNNGGIANASINTSTKLFGKASMTFNGGDDILEVNTKVTSDSTPFTYAVWFYPHSVPEASERPLITRGRDGFGDGWSVNLAAKPSGGQAALRLVTGITQYNAVGTSNLTEGRWHHVVGTWDRGKIRLYVNGELEATTGDTGSSLRSSTRGVVIGSFGDGAAINGSLDEVAVFNRTLNYSEIRALYYRGALRLNLSVRSCDDSACSGESFSEGLTNSSGSKLNNTIAPLNRYFQYRATLQTDDVNITPALYNVTINYSALKTDLFGNYNFTFAAPSSTGSYSIKINSTTDIGIPGEQMQSLTVIIPPVINRNFTIPTYPRFGQNVTIVANVTDEDNTIIYVNFSVTAPNGSITNFSNKSRVLDLHNFSINLSSYGTWKWNVTASDAQGNDVSETTGQIVLMEITESLNVSISNINSPIAVFGHINLSNNTNVSNRKISAWLNDGPIVVTAYTIKLTTSSFENGTQFSVGKGSNVTINADNITLQANSTNQYTNQTGNFTSQVIDTETNHSNFTFISWEGEAAYGTEIGRAVGDGNDAKLPAINTSGLVVMLHFNNDSLLGDNDTNSTDFSIAYNPERAGKTHNNGTFKNGAHYNLTEKKLGKASVEFDGTDDWVQLNNEVDVDFERTDRFSLGAWIKAPPVAGDGAIVSKQENSINYRGYTLFLNQPSFKLDLQSDTGDILSVQGFTNVTDDNWHFVVATYSGTGISSGVKLYADGVLESMTVNDETVSGTILNNVKPTIGSRDDGGTPIQKAKIDEVFIYNRTLTPAEVMNIYKRGAIRLNLSVRSCDDSACAGEAFSEPLTNNSGTRLNTTITPNNRYFQYRATLQTDDVNITPALYNVTVNYTTLATDRFGNYNFTFRSPSADGTYSIKVNTTTDTGIPGEQMQSLSVDATAPIVNTTINNTAPKRSHPVNLSANITDNIGLSAAQIIINQTGAKEYFNFTLSGTSAKVSQNFTIACFAGCAINFSVVANDTLSNQRTNDTILIVTNTPPSAPTLILPVNNFYSSTTLVNVSVTAPPDDDGDSITIQYFINNKLNQTSATNTTVNASDGTYGLNVTSYDGTDSSANTTSVNFTIDTVNPAVRLNSPINKSTISSSFIAAFTPNDANLANCTLYHNNSGVWKANVSITNAVSGSSNSFAAITVNETTFVWDVQCKDLAGNTAFNGSNFTIMIDLTAPTSFSLTAPANNTISKNLTPRFTWGATTEAFFTNYTLEISNGTEFNTINYSALSFVRTEGNATVSVDGNKTWFWRVIAFDNVSNNFTTGYFNYTTDTLRPIINGTLNKSLVDIANLDVINASFNATDDSGLSAGQVIINQTGAKEYFNFTLTSTREKFSQNFTVTCYSGCVINVTGRVNDTAGNYRQNETLITISPPAINYLNVSPIYPQFGRNFTLQANATDTNSNILSVNFTLIAPNGSKVINNKNASRVSGDLFNSSSFNLTAYGQWFWNVSAYDLEGFVVNTSTQEIIVMEITLSLNFTKTRASQPILVLGHVNLSNNTNVTGRQFTIHIDDVNITNVTTSSFGDYNFTITSNSTTKNYSIKVNGTTDIGIPGEQIVTLTVDATLPALNATLNITSPIRNESINLTANISDTTGISFAQFITNQTGAKEFFNRSLSGSAAAVASQNFTIACTKGCAINFSVVVNDTVNNQRTNDTIIEVANTPPKPPIINFPTSNLYTTTQPLALNVTGDDVDGEIDLNMSFYINGRLNQTSITNTTFNASDGYYILNVSASDNSAISSNTTANFTIDTKNPSVRVGGTNMSWSGANFTASFTPIDNNIKNCTLYHNNSGTWKENITKIDLTNGSSNSFAAVEVNETTFVWDVLCFDLAGNSAFNGSNLSVRIDSAVPTAFNLTTPSNNTFTSNISPTFRWNITVETNFANYTVEVSNGTDFATINFTAFSFVRTEGNATINLAINNTWYWRVIGYDLAGNNYTTGYFNYTVDNVAPAVKLNSPANFTFGGASFTASITPSDPNLANCTLYHNNSGVWKANVTMASPTSGASNSFTAITVSDSVFRWDAECFDRAGNSAFNNSNFTIRIDTAVPTAFNLTLPANNSAGTNFTPRFEWNRTVEANFANYTVEVSNQSDFLLINYTLYSSVITETNASVNLTANISWYWRVTAFDSAGNNYTTGFFKYTIDITPPKLSLNVSPTTAEGNIDNVSINWSATDNLEMFRNYTNVTMANGSRLFIYSSNFNLTIHNLTQKGLWNITLFANDTAGNVQTTTTTVNVRDTTAPTAFSLTSPADGTRSSNLTPLLDWQDTSEFEFLNYTVELSTSNSFAFINRSYKSGGNVTNSSFRITDALNGNLNWSWRVTAYDLSANSRISTNAFRYETSENTPPTAPNNSRPVNNTLMLFNNMNFTWNSSTDADGDNVTYELIVSKNAGFTSIDLNVSGMKSAHFDLRNNLSNLSDGKRFWRVRAFDGLNYSDYSSYTEVMSIVAVMNVTAPAENAKFYRGNTSNITIAELNGTAWIQNVTVEFNGTNYTPSSNGNNWAVGIEFSNLRSKHYNLTVFGFNQTNNLTAIATRTIIFSKISSSPRVDYACSNETYALNRTNVTLTFKINLDAVVNSTNATVIDPSNAKHSLNINVAKEELGDDDRLLYYYNATFFINQTGNFTLNISSADIEGNYYNSTSTFYSIEIAKTVNVSAINVTAIRMKNPCSGDIMVNGSNIVTVLPDDAKVDVEVSTEKPLILFKNVNLTNTTVLVNYTDVERNISPPSGKRIVTTQFEIKSNLTQFDNITISYNYTSIASALDNENNLAMYKCPSVSACSSTAWTLLATNLNTTENVISATVNSLSLFLVAETATTTTTTTVTNTVTTSSSGGGGGGGGSLVQVTKLIKLDIIIPQPLTMYLNDTLTVPIIIRNSGEVDLNNITLEKEILADFVTMDLTQTVFGKLAINESAATNMQLRSFANESARVEATLNATSKSPSAITTAKMYIDIVDRQKENKTVVVEKVKFLADLFQNNPECLELNELLKQAQQSSQNGEFEKAQALTESAINTCRQILSQKEGRVVVEKPKKPFRIKLSTPLLIVLGLLALLLLLYMSSKIRIHMPKFKPSKGKKQKRSIGPTKAEEEDIDKLLNDRLKRI